jgi:hypothetical protein
MRRIYHATAVADWDIPDAALVLPPDEETRALWGWKQDEAGQWYRELPDGASIKEPVGHVLPRHPQSHQPGADAPGAQSGGGGSDGLNPSQ